MSRTSPRFNIHPDDAFFWREFAVCRGRKDIEWFPPLSDNPKSGGGVPWDNPAARKLCAECPVRAACLEYAKVSRQKMGIWGGKVFKARRGKDRLKAKAWEVYI